MKVFLGGTCNGSMWRHEIIQLLDADYFNPVVADWTPDCMAEEIRQRKECELCLYVITPKMTGVYSIAEVIDDSNKKPDKTILVIIREDGGKSFDEGQFRSLRSVAKMANANGAHVCDNLRVAASFINHRSRLEK